MDFKRGISILGAGNMAWHLGVGFYRAGIPINGIFNRTIKNAEQLAKKVDAPFSDNYQAIPKDTCVVIVCVSDDSVAGVIEQLNPELPVVHTSGSLSLDILAKKFKEYGVFYPFQTFSKDVNPGELSFPVCLEANEVDIKPCLEALAQAISDKVVWIDSHSRKHIHLAGIMVNNFTNHLLARAFDYCENHQINRELLLPLLEETIRKIKTNHPTQVQTGPARRSNSMIIASHLELLTDDKNLYDIYNVMSQSIMAYYS